MAKGFCEDCQKPQDIVPKGQIHKDFSARYWELVVHKDPKAERLCDGSGKRI